MHSKMDAHDEDDAESEPALEDNDAEEQGALEEVPTPLVSPPDADNSLVQVSLEAITQRSPPVAKKREFIKLPQEEAPTVSLSWDIDALDVFGSLAQLATAIGSCNVRVKSLPER